MASAVEQLVGDYSQSQPVSFYDFYNAYGRDHAKTKWIDADPYGVGGSLQNWAAGTRTSAEKEYENYLSEFQYRRDLKATAAANAEKYAREDSEVQRRKADYEKAGLNPYLILTGAGGSLGSATSSASEYARYKRASSKEKESKDASKLIGTAIRAIAMIAMLAG